MLSYILSALSVARHAVALTLVTAAAATTMVAGSFDQAATHTQQETAPMNSPAPTTRPEPVAKPEVTPGVTTKSATPETSSKPDAKTRDVESLVKDCLAKYAAAKDSTTAGTAGTAASEACRRAIEDSGLTSTEFWARFAPKTMPTTPPQKPSTKPSTNPSTDIEALAKYCITKYTAAKDNATAANTASEVCRRAIEASGLSTTEFWAKFGRPQSPKTEPKPTASPTVTDLSQLTKYCLTMHAALTTTSSHEQVERTTTICNQAIAESKLTPTQFWTKFSATR